MPDVSSDPGGPVPGVSRSNDLVMEACEDGMDSSSDDLAPDLDVEGEGGDAKNLSNVVVKSEPVHCAGTEPGGAGPVAGASSSYDLAVASSEPVNDGQGGDSTECSSSFGGSCCKTDDEADHGDPEVNSPFSAHADGDQASTLPRKKKVTAKWRKAVCPMLWRCQWLELRMKDLLSQVSKYDKQLALIKQGKELQQAVTKTNGSRTESGQHYRGHENSSMERIKRKRHEDTVDTSLYIKKHQILSYFYDKQNKGAETDGLLIEDSNGPVGDDIKGGLDTAGLFEKSKEYDMVSEQLNLQKILLTIAGIQSQVHRLQERLSKARSKQEKMSSMDHAQVKVAEKRQRTKKRSFSYKYEYDRYTKPHKKKNIDSLLKEDRPAHAVISTLSESERATGCLIEDAKGNSEEKGGERSQSHKKAITVDLLLDVDSSLPNGHMGDLCRENADDILIDNQAAKEGYQPFENVKHPLEKSPVLTEKIEKTAPSKVENTSAPVKVENTAAPAVKQEPVLEKPPALKVVYSGKKRGRKPKKKDGCSASASKNQSKGAFKTPTAKNKTESTSPGAKKHTTETTPPAAVQKNESACSKKQKTMKTPFPAKKGKTGNSSAGKKQKAESSSSAARKETSENTPKLRIEKAVLVAVNSRRSQRVRKPKIY